MKTFTFDSVYAGDTSGITRARDAISQKNSFVVGGFAGLNYHGVPYWISIRPAVLHSAGTAGQATSSLVILASSTPLAVPGLDPGWPHLRVATPATCVIDALQLIRTGRAQWYVPAIKGLTDTDIRSIQVIDAARRKCKVSWDELKAAGRYRFNAKELRRLCALSSSGADSPQETLTRLILSDLAPDPVDQLAIFHPSDKEFPLTVADLSWKGIKVAVFYDGEHHLTRQQRNRDSEIRNGLEELGWEYVAITASDLTDPNRLRARVRRAIYRALARG